MAMKWFRFAFCVLIISGCQDVGLDDGSPAVTTSPYQGKLEIFFENDFLCVGQSSKIHAVQVSPWKEIPLSEIIFNPLKAEEGTISSSGVYTAPFNLTKIQTIKISAKFKNGASVSLSGEIQIFPKGLFPNTGVRSIEYQLGIYRPFAKLENGDLVFGSSRDMMYASLASTKEMMRVSPDGKLIWAKDLSPFNSIYLKAKRGKIFSVGGAENMGIKAFVLDESGEIILDFPLNFKGFIRSFFVNDAGDLYFLVKDYEKKINQIIAFNDLGELLFEKNFLQEIAEIQLTTDGTIIGMAREGENESSKQVLFSLDPDLENFKVVYEEKLDWPYVVDSYFLLPDNRIGIFKLIDKKSLSDTQWIVDILNIDGTEVIKNKIIHESTPGVQRNTEAFLNNVKERDLDQITNVLITKDSSVFIAGFSYNQTNAFLEIVNMDNEDHWYYPLVSSEDLGIYPVSFIEKEELLIYTVDIGGKVKSFVLDKNLDFDPCAFPAYWN